MKTKYKIILLLILWFAAFIPVYPSLFHTWINHSDNSQCLFAPLFAAYFVFLKREQLKVAPMANSDWGGLILILSMAFYLLSFAGGIAVLARVTIVTSLIGLVLFTLGKEVFKILSFPLLILFFMVPVPDSILGLVSFPLQLFATNISTFLLQGLSVPAYQEGNMVYFAETQLEIAEACSGIRSIMSFTMISFIFAYFLDKSWWKRVVFIVSAIPLALLVNIIRITSTGVLANKYGAKVALGFLHEFSGIVMFLSGCILLLGEFFLLTRGKKH
jgi:exosortase